MDAVLKLENHNLMRAREVATTGNLQSERYRWMHGLLRRLVQDVAPGSPAPDAGYTAHALLATLRVDLIDELLATGHSVEDIRQAQAAHVLAVLDRASRPG